MLKQRYAFLAATFIVVLISLQSGIADGKNEINFVLDTTVFYIINYFAWALLIPFISRLISRDTSSYLDLLPILFQGALLILFHFITTNIVYFLLKQFYEVTTLYEFLSITSNYLYESLFRRFIDLLLIFGLLKLIDNYLLSVKRKEQMEALKLQLQEVKFETLKSQLNPHFLFNALHSVYTLIGYEDEKAKKMIIRISDMLRKLLDDSDNQFISLSEELKYVEDYLAIEKERFHDRLSVELHIDEESKAVKVPLLILQPLVENAIKHGIAPLEDGGKIEVFSKIEANDLRIIVGNPKPITTQKTVSLGIGLNNLNERLKSLSHNYSLDTKMSENRFEVSIILKDQALV